MINGTMFLATHCTIVLQHCTNMFILTGFRIGTHLLLILQANSLLLTVTEHFSTPGRPSGGHVRFA